jgi:hypothetical protein
MLIRARHRLRIAVLVIGCLMFQQVALAAYSCARDAAPVPAESTGPCADMDMAPRASQAPALCEKHCAPDQALPSDTVAQAVPALALPPLFELVLEPPASHLARQAEVPVTRSDPPSRLRYCSLQI